MKLFSQTFIFCFFVVLSLEFLDSISAAKFRGYGNSSNDSVISDGDYQQQDIRSSDAMLLSDGNEHGTEVGEDVVLSGTGPINLTLTNEILVFEVCKSCMGTSTVCYEASRGSHVPNAIGGCRGPSSCEFKVNGTDQKVFFGEASVLKEQFISPCSSTTRMEHPFAHFLSDFINFESCEPKMDDKKVIKLYVNIKEGCSIKVKGAKIHLPEVQTTQLPLIGPPTQSPSNDSTKASSFPDWGYIIIGIVVLIAIAAIIGCTVYYLCKKRQTSKRVLPNVAETKPKSTVSKADVAADIEAPTKETKPNPTPSKAKEVMVETPTKKNDDLKAVKVVSTQMPKKEKKQKTTTQEPKTTEDVPAPTVSKPEPPTPASKEHAPTVTQEEPASTEQPPPTAACYPQVKRLIPRGMKSAKSDSLDQTLKKDKTAMTESFIVSTENLCLKTDQSEVSDEVKAAYPDIQHEVLDSEIKLLCVPVSEMFTEMNTLVYESIRKLAAAGCKFGVNFVIVSVSKGGRRFLKDPTTDATTVYFAFGAEHHKYITDDPEIIEKASVPLLYVIALQPRFPDASRRKACALLRRKLVKVLGWYKAADRAKMPFPFNIVEHAYCRDPKYFYDPDEIKTHSGSDGKKKRIADAKRKKKSSKKR